ncbi:MAG: thermonuclease family protein [Alphaproteobacteria bacterium]|nr:thermonuclease family protein [Alphaproteobacteria bacterium]
MDLPPIDHAPAAEIRVIDGDTIRIREEIIRLMNIDAPELTGGCAASRRLASLAAERLQELVVAAGPGNVEIHRAARADRYGRTLAQVRGPRGDFAVALASEELAVPWSGRRHDWCRVG